jgi:hypothetical protein
MSMKPLPRRIQKREVKKAIEHARLICTNYETTQECHKATMHAEELKKQFIVQCKEDNHIWDLHWAENEI